MNLYATRDLARSLMASHGLVGWTFHFDHARRRFGTCSCSRKRITLSRPLTLLNGEDEVRDTILHEIAHALTPGDGHGRKWKAACVKIGAKPLRCYTDVTVVSPPRRAAPLQVGCPRCGWWQDRHRASKRKLICRYCRTRVIFRESAQVASPPIVKPKSAAAKTMVHGLFWANLSTILRR